MTIIERTREERIANGWPVPYLLDDPSEVARLFREVSGYLHTCRREHHGTDFEGRRFAIEALDTLVKGGRAIAAAISKGAET